MTFKSGYAAIVGRPNVGKSTLINAILGERLSIVTPKPQTTRHKITGILNLEDAQIIFLDTPGYHKSSKPLNEAMNDVVDQVLGDADCVCLMIEAGKEDIELERALFDRIGSDRAIVVLNKCDLVEKERFDGIAAKFKDVWGVKELVIISALNNLGVITLTEAIKNRLPVGEKFYPDDSYTAHSVRFLASEIIREQVFIQMQQEIPYSTAVEIEEFRDATEEKPVTFIRASIVVEKESQKGMVVGKGAKRVKEIGKRSRKGIEELVGGKVFLELNVRVENDWTKDPDKVGQLGYRQQND